MNDNFFTEDFDLSELEDLTRPICDYLKKYHNPHTKIIIDQTIVEVVQGQYTVNHETYVHDDVVNIETTDGHREKDMQYD